MLSAANILQALALATAFATVSAKTTCSNNLVSCHNISVSDNTCCVNAPAGTLIHTQTWDYNSSSSPSDVWTISGLLTADCSGNIVKNCDPARAYSNISNILGEFKQTLLRTQLSTDWLNQSSSTLGLTENEVWAQAWDTYGTCLSTLSPTCFGAGYVQGQEVPPYFRRAVNLYRNDVTYLWLRDAGIVPSKAATYTSNVILGALKAQHGHPVYIYCDGNKLSGVAYYYNVAGSLANGQISSIAALGGASTCPSNGVMYLPKA